MPAAIIGQGDQNNPVLGTLRVWEGPGGKDFDIELQPMQRIKGHRFEERTPRLQEILLGRVGDEVQLLGCVILRTRHFRNMADSVPVRLPGGEHHEIAYHPFSELTKNFSPERQARVAEKVQLLKQEMALAELRKARQQSQADLAARLQVQQPAIAKMEHRADMYVSNLRRFIEAMGGRLEIVAHFPEGSVTITNFCEVEAAETDDTTEHTR